MKKTHSNVLSSLVLSGAVFVMTPHAWSQTGGTSGTGSAPSGSEKSSDPSGTGSSSRGKSGTTGSSSSSTDMQTQKDQSGSVGSSRSASERGRMSKDKVKEVQSALKNKAMDPGPEDGVLGPKTQSALREFQKSNSLQATGRIDEKTASALGVDVASSGSSGSSSGTRSSSKDSTSLGSGAGSGSQSSTSGSLETSKGISKRGNEAGSEASGGARGGTSAGPATKPTGRE